MATADSYDIQIGFATWMLVGVPLSMTLLLIAWFWLTKSQLQSPSTRRN